LTVTALVAVDRGRVVALHAAAHVELGVDVDVLLALLVLEHDLVVVRGPPPGVERVLKPLCVGDL
jgi:hypothetical protein